MDIIFHCFVRNAIRSQRFLIANFLTHFKQLIFLSQRRIPDCFNHGVQPLRELCLYYLFQVSRAAAAYTFFGRLPELSNLLHDW